ncbi:hypothetical protein GCM10011367_17350 [Marinicauda pacifica]|uniref:DNA-binding protein n=1 Tax=Marinicauda pacifica TaxID=1133559 RepID=A0A4V3RZ72_9PROT|nr:helix-turn-helix domain-containing protein [Marinicauda pacifica]TGY93139.1 DNA-binding protein [Marinicauda pacifica]GGE43190.1 hypothetical protein GCM10011367_17350 [Marinicauda pacifica]
MSPQTTTDKSRELPARALTIADFVRAYGISRAKTYELLKAGELRAVKVGRRTLVPVTAAEAWFNALPEA